MLNCFLTGLGPGKIKLKKGMLRGQWTKANLQFKYSLLHNLPPLLSRKSSFLFRQILELTLKRLLSAFGWPPPPAYRVLFQTLCSSAFCDWLQPDLKRKISLYNYFRVQVGGWRGLLSNLMEKVCLTEPGYIDICLEVFPHLCPLATRFLELYPLIFCKISYL